MYVNILDRLVVSKKIRETFGCMYAATFGCMSMPFGCMYAETVGCMYAVVGCKSAETFGCKVCGCWVQVSYG